MSYRVAVEWFDQVWQVMAIETDGTPLIGMQMLRDSRMTIDVVPNGRVQIEPLPASP